MSIRELRPELLERCDILQAILAFNYALTTETKRQIEASRARIPLATSRELREIRDRLHDPLKQSVKRFGCVKDPSEFAAEFIAGSRVYGVPNISKAVIDREYFTNFCCGNSTWQGYPPHLRLQVHFDWVVSAPLIFHYWLPEAVLYEDMALAFNLGFESESSIKNLGYLKGGNLGRKKHDMYLRTALLSAYYFVEAYLNGIAVDYHYRNENTLSQADKDLLNEWNSQTNRQRFLSFEAKIKEYPKIILRESVPPLTIANCKELAILLGDAKELRDAIVHQSSKTPDIKSLPHKVRWLQSVNLDKTREVVEAAVGFVMRLNEILGANGIKFSWLCPPDAVSGSFPPNAFE